MKNIGVIVQFALLFTGIFFANDILNLDLNQYGIVPRQVDSLPFILSSPFLHGNLSHLLSNLVGFGIFSFVILQTSQRYFYQSSLFIIVVGGLGVWLFARQGVHIGASGLIFGMWALIIARAFFERKFKYILVAMLVIFFQGGMIFGVLPTSPYISFEAHLFGAIAGGLYAYFFHGKAKRAKLS